MLKTPVMSSTIQTLNSPTARLAFLALVMGAVSIGFAPIFVRLADVGPVSAAFWRMFLALPILWLWMRQSATPDTAPPPRRNSRC